MSSSRVWPQHGRQAGRVFNAGVKPCGIFARVENDRHAVVDWPYERVGIGGDDGASLDARAVRALPAIP